MNKIDNHLQNSQLTTFVTLGLVFGAFGIHDFYIGKEKDGLLHLLSPAVLFVFSYFFPAIPFLMGDDGHYFSETAEVAHYVIKWLPLAAFVISWILAIKEVVDYVKKSEAVNKKDNLRVAFFISAILFAIIISIALGFIFGFPTFLIN